MRLALYHPWIYLCGGAERVVAEVVARSRHDWVIYTHHFEPESTYPCLRSEVVELGPPVSVRRSLSPLVRAAATMTRTRLPEDGSRALLVSSEGLGDLLLARTRLPAVAYCHTPLKILHDPEVRAELARRDPTKAAVLRMLGRPFQSADAALWRRYCHVLVNSNETRRRVLKGRLAPDPAVEVLYPGVDLQRYGAQFAELETVPAAQEREPLFLVAGRMVWQKKLELAIDAMRIAIAMGMKGRLVIAGAVDAKSREYVNGLKARAEGLPVTFEERPTDERLIELYQEATALLFTAPNEDWGIVPLEAMASGTPVIAVASGGPCESVLHGKTGWLLPGRPKAFADQMLAVCAMPEEIGRMRSACRLRAARYDWDRFVARIDDVMEEVATTGAVTAPLHRIEPDRAQLAELARLESQLGAFAAQR
jgi:glycosyltransferase involved in cell wall biosynthesis